MDHASPAGLPSSSAGTGSGPVLRSPGRRAPREGSRDRRGGQARRGRRDVRVPGQVSRPPFGARLGVLAVPADVGAGLAAVRDQQAGRESDTAQRALGGRQGTLAVVTLRGHRRVAPREWPTHLTTASSSDSIDRSASAAGEADAAIIPPTGHQP